jgi:hypothetical protein
VIKCDQTPVLPASIIIGSEEVDDHQASQAPYYIRDFDQSIPGRH